MELSFSQTLVRERMSKVAEQQINYDSRWMLFIYIENRTKPYSTRMSLMIKEESRVSEGQQPMEQMSGEHGISTPVVLHPGGPTGR